MKLAGMILIVGVACLPAAAFAGQPDEIGKGGFDEPSYELGVDVSGPVSSAELEPALGVTVSYWNDEWLQLETSVGASGSDGVRALIGPRLRTAGYPWALHAGVQAGIVGQDGRRARLGVAPHVGIDVLLNNEWTFDLDYVVDLAMGAERVEQRVGMSVGYRFGGRK